jgi:hypothetical protein
MWTRRQVLVGAGLAGALGPSGILAVPPAPAGTRTGMLRVGLLQSAPPFVDEADLPGSRQRAFAALRVLMERGADAHPDIDWLVAGPWALAVAGSLSPGARAMLALHPGSAEVLQLRGLVRERALSMTLPAWWRDRDGQVAARVVSVARDGSLAVHEPGGAMAAWPHETFRSACARLGLPGACVEPARDPAAAPHVALPVGGGTRLVGANGRTIVAAVTQAETCVVGDLSW